MEPVGLEVALGESVSEWWMNVKDVLYTTVDFIDSEHFGYTKFI